MNTKTIEDIRNIRDNIRIRIKTIDLKRFEEQTFGSEKEYTYRSLIGEVESLLTDLSTLIQYKNKFLKLSDYSDRNIIISHLNSILSNIENPSSLYNNVDNLKKILRNYNIRNFSEHQIEFEKEIDEVRKIKMDLEDILKEALIFKSEIQNENSLIREKQDDIDEKFKNISKIFESIDEKLSEISNETDKQQNLNDKLIEIKAKAKTSLEAISEFEKEANASTKLITSFSNNIQDRESKLDKIQSEINKISQKISDYEEERKRILEEANILIESAKQALKYKTAEGLSAAFSSQYKEANQGWFYLWLVGAAICLAGAGYFGWKFMESVNENNQWFIVLGRILLLPIPIMGAIFCANQYTKQKNIAEDYAYKQTIAKTIVGFSEQLKKNGKDGDNSEYVEYIRKALEEIHKDPLRNRKEDKPLLNFKDNHYEQAIELAKKIIDIGKQGN